MKKLLFIISIFLTIQSYGQLSSSEKTELKLLLAQRVNDLREEKGIPPLKFDRHLGDAAQIQADYVKKFKKLTHEQRRGELRTVMDRVLNVGGDMYLQVGENLLVTTPQSAPFTKRDLKSIAWEMFILWKNSPGHYQNMVNPEFKYADFGFNMDSKSGKIYAAQVFGSRGTKIKGQLSRNSFGIKKANAECKELIGRNSNVITNMGNSLQREDNKVIFWHHNKASVERVVRNPLDGIAVDLIRPNQFQCGQPNELDMSPVYDGILLKPVYKQELLDSNRAQGDYRLISAVGEIPPGLDTGNVQFSILIIKNGRQCAYAVPAFIPFSGYDLLPVEPKMINPDVPFLTEGITRSVMIPFNFARNQVVPTVDPELYLSSNVHSAEVVSYSSIEGDSYHNSFLHNNRGQYIADYVKKMQGDLEFDVSIRSKENWDKCYFQLEKLGLDEMKSKSRQIIKEFVMTDTLRNWDSLLFIQRKSHAIIHYTGESDTTLKAQLEMNLRTAIIEEEFDLANRSMAELHKNGIVSTVLLEEAVMEKLFKHKELVQNSTVLLTGLSYYAQERVVEFVSNWIKRSDQLEDDAISNLLFLYAVTTKDILDVWDVHAKSLAKVINPVKVKVLADKQQINSENQAPAIKFPPGSYQLLRPGEQSSWGI